ncbi:MAG: type II 3-dehydroquinate dehydratase [Paracoccaceae bacterium]
MTQVIFLLNGPNLNLLGSREPEIYGHETLQDVETACQEHANTRGFQVICHQSNHEGDLVGWIQEARQNACAIILNAGAYTHTSIAILDALRSFDGVIIEVHISNPKTREAFRHTSLIEPAADKVIAGQGVAGYVMAIDAVADIMKTA